MDVRPAALMIADRPMKIAIISSVPCFPTGWGSQRRILNLVKALQRLGHDVWFLYLSGSSMAKGLVQAHEAQLGPGRFQAGSGQGGVLKPA